MTKLYDEYRAAQNGLAREVTDGLALTMGALDLRRVDASAPGWLAAATSVVRRGHAKGVTIGSDFASQFQGAVSGQFSIKPGSPDVASMVTSLTVLGPYRAKKLMGGGADISVVAKELFAGITGAGVRHSLDGVRSTVSRSSWTRMRRIPQSGCCGFCAMLATRDYWVNTGRDVNPALTVIGRRGGIRRGHSQPLGESYHDHCKCTVSPVSEEIQPDDYEERLDKYEDAYYLARERAERLPGGTTSKNIIREMNKLQRAGAF